MIVTETRITTHNWDFGYQSKKFFEDWMIVVIKSTDKFQYATPCWYRLV
jgi:hypothetical protein